MCRVNISTEINWLLYEILEAWCCLSGARKVRAGEVKPGRPFRVHLVRTPALQTNVSNTSAATRSWIIKERKKKTLKCRAASVTFT